MRRLKDIGFNRVYVEVWKNGYTQFPSRTLKALIGLDRHPALKGRDLLRETVEEARRQGLRCIAWFEYGFMAAHEGTDNELVRRYPDWLTLTRNGRRVSNQNPFIWMNPMRPEPQKLLLGIIEDAVRGYPIDGIQLDDRLGWPTSMGYDSYTRNAYANVHGGVGPPEEEKNASWIQWRADQVTAFAGRLHERLRRLKPGLIVSVSPAVYPWSKENYACDWPTWLRSGWFTEAVPQVYRRSPADFSRDWEIQLRSCPGAEKRLLAGIMGDAGEEPIPWPDLRKNLARVRADGRGHVIWFSRSVLNSYGENLKAFYRSTEP